MVCPSVHLCCRGYVFLAVVHITNILISGSHVKLAVAMDQNIDLERFSSLQRLLILADLH